MIIRKKYKKEQHGVVKYLENKLNDINYQIESIDFELQVNKHISSEELARITRLRERFVNARKDFFNCIEFLKRGE